MKFALMVVELSKISLEGAYRALMCPMSIKWERVESI